MPIYRTTGRLTGVIERENVPMAQAYLTEDNMAQYLDAPLRGVVEHLEWRLDGNGRDYSVTAFAVRELTEPELAKLGDEVSGQNSDGLGEGFEQQDFAWKAGYEYDGMISFDWKTNPSTFVRVT